MYRSAVTFETNVKRTGAMRIAIAIAIATTIDAVKKIAIVTRGLDDLQPGLCKNL
jgi:hypothetical protein